MMGSISLNPNANTATNSFKYYLSNTKRSGGERGVEIERDPDNSFLIAYFSSKEVAVRVAEKKHKLEDCPLHVEVFDPNLGDVHRKRTKESRKLSSEVDINIPEPASGNLYPDLRSFEDSADGSGTAQSKVSDGTS
nr:hypothetical protein BaRGS_034423 [Batillaria attramentaria]